MPGSSGSSQMAPIALVTAFAKHSINFNRRNLASQTIPLDVAIQQWELLVLDLILSGLRILVTNRKGFLKPSHMVALRFLICSGQATWDQSMCFPTVACLIVMEADCQCRCVCTSLAVTPYPSDCPSPPFCSLSSFCSLLSFILSFHFLIPFSIPSQYMYIFENKKSKRKR